VVGKDRMGRKKERERERRDYIRQGEGDETKGVR